VGEIGWLSKASIGHRWIDTGGVETGSDTEAVSAALGSTGLAVGCDEVMRPVASSRPAPSAGLVRE